MNFTQWCHNEGDTVNEWFYSCVAKPVSLSEAAKIDKARGAMEKEWDKLRGLEAWDEVNVR